jgi:probable HAF family extracellular repeat protein
MSTRTAAAHMPSINNTGQMVGTSFDASGMHGFLYSGGVITPINDPLAPNKTFAEGINDAGEIVGIFYDSKSHPFGFLYSGGHYTTIVLTGDLAGFTTQDVHGINNRSQIVGTAYLEPGVPELSSWAMMLLGFAGLGFAFRRSPRTLRLA